MRNIVILNSLHFSYPLPILMRVSYNTLIVKQNTSDYYKYTEKKYFYRCASTDKSENKPLPPILKPFRPHLSLSLSNGKTWLKTLNKKMPYAMKLLRGVRCRIEIIYKMKYGL